MFHVSMQKTVRPQIRPVKKKTPTCTCPNPSRVGAIDKSDRPEQAFDQYDIPEAPEKIFTNNFSIVGH